MKEQIYIKVSVGGLKENQLPSREVCAVDEEGNMLVGYLNFVERNNSIMCVSDECEMENVTHHLKLIPAEQYESELQKELSEAKELLRKLIIEEPHLDNFIELFDEAEKFLNK